MQKVKDKTQKTHLSTCNWHIGRMLMVLAAILAQSVLAATFTGTLPTAPVHPRYAFGSSGTYANVEYSGLNIFSWTYPSSRNCVTTAFEIGDAHGLRSVLPSSWAFDYWIGKIGAFDVECSFFLICVIVTNSLSLIKKRGNK